MNVIANRRFVTTAGELFIAVLCFASANVRAQVSTTRMINGALVSTTEPKASAVTHPKSEEPLPPGVTLIYSNFGTGGTTYYPGQGWDEAGGGSLGLPTTPAMAFTPDDDYILVRINAAFEYSSGTNGVKLLLAEDSGGVPGQILYETSFSNLPPFGTCCPVQTAKLHPTASSHVGLKAHQQYWLYPLPADSTSVLAWNLNGLGLSGNVAASFDYGQTWTPLLGSNPLGAFDLYGIPLPQ